MLPKDFQRMMQMQHDAPYSRGGSSKKQARRLLHNLEVERWAFGDYDNYGEISMLDLGEEDGPGEISVFKKNKLNNGEQQQQKASSENGKENNENEEEEGKKKRPKSSLMKRGNNTMSRLVPGALQKNITTERQFFKDILQLSQQRYVNLHSLEFQKKAFVNRQTIKGIYRVEPKRSLASSMSMNSSGAAASVGMNDSTITTTTTSYDLPPMTPRLRSESVYEVKSLPNMNRRQSLNVSSARKLNLELQRMHTIDLIELENKKIERKKSSKTLKSTDGDHNSSLVDETVVQEIKEINNPVVQRPPVEATPAIPQIRSKTIKIVEEPKMKKRFTVTDDARYQSLLVTMTNVYRPTTASAKQHANENPNDRIIRLYKSNTVFLKDSCHTLAIQEQEKRNKMSFEENFRNFEKAISNII